jgi:diguanylate cyclase (GGDEF)-like protein
MFRQLLRRYGGLGSLAIIDQDNFKQINDTQGHLAGDALLRDFCRLCAANLRASDTFARYGGDEFIMWRATMQPGTRPSAWAATK